MALWHVSLLLLLLKAVDVSESAGLQANRRIDLSDDQWILTGADQNGTAIIVNATVPGDVYSHLYAAGIIGEPLKAEHDTEYAWVGEHDWMYTKLISVDNMRISSPVSRVLAMEGIDTIAETYINGRQVANHSNMWHEYLVELKWYLQHDTVNNISIVFRSPVVYAREQQEKFEAAHGYTIPPDGPPTNQNGRDHVNFIRKMQSSFSWDWGPSFPTVGFWRPLYLHLTDSCFFQRATGVPVLSAHNIWTINVDIYMYCTHMMVDGAQANLNVDIPELDLTFTTRSDFHSKLNHFHFELQVEDNKVERWWPNGYGKQRMYDMVVQYFPSGFRDHKEPPDERHRSKIAFRSVELVQQQIEGFNYESGLTYYFKINGVPIFLKGTNFIPSSPFPDPASAEDRLRFLFSSMIAANMNSLRLWGGGQYETDLFYELADELGLMIWHDCMFAVSLYPTDDEYLASVAKEVVDQTQRLRHHPSIIIWAGNNENELGLVGGWFGSLHTMANFSTYRDEYVKLYHDTIWTAINASDYHSRPYVMSSPSNGQETVRQGGVSLTISPGSDRFGDVHVYDYVDNAWRPDTYPVPRCVTEFGVQSYPPASTFKAALGENAEWAYFSEDVLHRQHHPGGNVQMVTQAFAHFTLPSYIYEDEHAMFCSSRNVSDLKHTFLYAMSFLSQAHQAIAYQTEVEHYRRHRNRTLPDGRGQTMCALYWQLQDIWAAPTWASIDVDLHWKMAHYYARRFFAPVILSLYFDLGVENEPAVRLAIVSDLPYAATPVSDIKIEALSWKGGDPVWSVFIRIAPIPAFYSGDYFFIPFNTLPLPIDQLVFRASLHIEQDINIPEAILLPDKLYRTNPAAFGKATISSVTVSEADDRAFIVYLKAVGVVPLVWLETPLRGNFSDNALTITRPQHKVTFNCWTTEPDCHLAVFKKSLSLTTLRDLYT